MEDHILIRYGELSLKKSNRKQFTIRIQNHIKRALKEFKQLSFESRSIRYYIMLNNEDSQPIIEILKKIPGIYSFSVVSRCKSNLNDINLLAKELVQKELNQGKKTFKIDKTPLSFKQEKDRIFIKLPQVPDDIDYVIELVIKQ